MIDNERIKLKDTFVIRKDFIENLKKEDGMYKFTNFITSVQEHLSEREDQAIIQEIIEVSKKAGYTSVTIINEDYIKRLFEKDQPKKAVWNRYSYIDMHCPNCGLYIDTTYRFPNYCYNCGQHLDWSFKQEEDNNDE